MPLCMGCGSMYSGAVCAACQPNMQSNQQAEPLVARRAAPPIPTTTNTTNTTNALNTSDVPLVPKRAAPPIPPSTLGGGGGGGGGDDDFSHLFPQAAPVAEGEKLKASFAFDNSQSDTVTDSGLMLDASSSAPRRGWREGGLALFDTVVAKIDEGIQKAKSLKDRPSNTDLSHDHNRPRVKPIGGVTPVTELTRTRLARSFPAIAPNEPLLGEFWCSAVSGDLVLDGAMFLTAHHFCFVAPYNNRKVTVAIPFWEVLDIKRAVETGGGGYSGSGGYGGSGGFTGSNNSRSVRGVPLSLKRVEANEDPSASIMLIYTADMQVHQFFDVCLVDTFESWFKMVELAWKKTIKREKREHSGVPYHSSHPLDEPIVPASMANA